VELHQLRYLVAVVESGSFTAAAERVHVSQSGVSAQVAKLEQELGQRLLERGSRTTSLTAAGEAVLPIARAVLAGVDQISDVSDEYSGVVRGRVRLGMIRGCSIPTFLDALAAFRAEHPGVELVLAEDDSDVLMHRVSVGDLDVALVGWAGDPLPGLEVVTVVDEQVAAVLPESHRLTGRTTVRWRDLDEETLLCLSRGTGIRSAVDRSRAAAGIEPRVDLEACSPDTLLGLVRRDVGVALLSESMARGVPGLVARPIADASVSARLGVVIRRGESASAPQALHDRLAAALVAQAGSGAQQRPKV
jgi:DNA-binding transcriptional LysR family regulator